MSRSQIAWNRSVPLVTCWTYTTACGLRGSGFRRSAFRSDRGRPRRSTVKPEQIEGIKTERQAAPHQFVRHGPTVRPRPHDLAVQDGAPAGELLADGLRRVRESLERIPVARSQLAGAALDISDRAEAVQLRLEDPVPVLEGRIETSLVAGPGLIASQLRTLPWT